MVVVLCFSICSSRMVHGNSVSTSYGANNNVLCVLDDDDDTGQVWFIKEIQRDCYYFCRTDVFRNSGYAFGYK